MIDSLKQTLEELRKQRVKYYSIFDYTLDVARANESLFVAGGYIYVLKLDGTAKIKLNEISGDDIDLFKYRQIGSPFYRFFLTHSAQPGKVLSLAVGVGSEVFSVQDFQSPDLSAMAADISDMRKALSYNYGQQVAKSNVISGVQTVIVHTVSTGKYLLLEGYTLSTDGTGTGYFKVRNASDVDQYNLQVIQVYSNLVANFAMLIPEGYDIVLVGGAGNIWAFVKGREITL